MHRNDGARVSGLAAGQARRRGHFDEPAAAVEIKTDGETELGGRVAGLDPQQVQPRSAPPVRLPTSATILAATASISGSVIVLSRGCKVTAMAIDFLSGSMPLPS